MVRDTFRALRLGTIDTVCCLGVTGKAPCASRGPSNSRIWRHDETNNAIDLYKEISRAVDDLATCSYATEAFTELLNQIQAAVRLGVRGLTRPTKTPA